MSNSAFEIPKRTQKVTSVQSVQVLQYREALGNLPSDTKYGNILTEEKSAKIISQRFTGTTTKLKAFGLYLQASLRNVGDAALDGTLQFKLYKWNGGSPTSMSMDNGKPAETEIKLGQIRSMDETVFEFEDYVTCIIGEEYFFSILYLRGAKPRIQIRVATTAQVYDGVALVGQAYYYDLATNTPTQMTPQTDLVFLAYQSITELSVEINGPGGKTLTDIYDVLSTPSNHTYNPSYGIVDYTKPYLAHSNGVIDSINKTGNIFSTVGAHAGFSDVADLVVDLSVTYDMLVIETSEDIRIDWAKTGDYVAGCGTSYRLLFAGDAIAIPEYASRLFFRLNAAGDTPPIISITAWQTASPASGAVPIVISLLPNNGNYDSTHACTVTGENYRSVTAVKLKNIITGALINVGTFTTIDPSTLNIVIPIICSKILDFVDFTTAEPVVGIGDSYINTVTGISSVTFQPVTANHIYTWNGVNWTDTTPAVGLIVFNDNDNFFYYYSGGIWNVFVSNPEFWVIVTAEGGTNTNSQQTWEATP